MAGDTLAVECREDVRGQETSEGPVRAHDIVGDPSDTGHALRRRTHSPRDDEDHEPVRIGRFDGRGLPGGPVRRRSMRRRIRPRHIRHRRADSARRVAGIPGPGFQRVRRGLHRCRSGLRDIRERQEEGPRQDGGRPKGSLPQRCRRGPQDRPARRHRGTGRGPGCEEHHGPGDAGQVPGRPEGHMHRGGHARMESEAALQGDRPEIGCPLSHGPGDSGLFPGFWSQGP